ncbi:hypothetical protein MKX70_24100 [Paenibacillus sp. FSL R7-0312]|uniref:hypothetical protein n=1 Tax=Paenibacillus sp. FSL R7-0312 TaxID=2921682 RepID=UPI0030F80590
MYIFVLFNYFDYHVPSLELATVDQDVLKTRLASNYDNASVAVGFEVWKDNVKAHEYYQEKFNGLTHFSIDSVIIEVDKIMQSLK